MDLRGTWADNIPAATEFVTFAPCTVDDVHLVGKHHVNWSVANEALVGQNRQYVSRKIDFVPHA